MSKPGTGAATRETAAALLSQLQLVFVMLVIIVRPGRRPVLKLCVRVAAIVQLVHRPLSDALLVNIAVRLD